MLEEGVSERDYAKTLRARARGGLALLCFPGMRFSSEANTRKAWICGEKPRQFWMSDVQNAETAFQPCKKVAVQLQGRGILGQFGLWGCRAGSSIVRMSATRTRCPSAERRLISASLPG